MWWKEEVDRNREKCFKEGSRRSRDFLACVVLFSGNSSICEWHFFHIVPVLSTTGDCLAEA